MKFYAVLNLQFSHSGFTIYWRVVSVHTMTLGCKQYDANIFYCLDILLKLFQNLIINTYFLSLFFSSLTRDSKWEHIIETRPYTTYSIRSMEQMSTISINYPNKFENLHSTVLYFKNIFDNCHFFTMIFSKIKNIKQIIRNVWCKGNIRYQSTQKPAPGAVMLSHNTLEPRSLTEPLGPPLLILHGLMGSKQNWRQISKQIHNGMNHARKVI